MRRRLINCLLLMIVGSHGCTAGRDEAVTDGSLVTVAKASATFTTESSDSKSVLSASICPDALGADNRLLQVAWLAPPQTEPHSVLTPAQGPPEVVYSDEPSPAQETPESIHYPEPLVAPPVPLPAPADLEGYIMDHHYCNGCWHWPLINAHRRNGGYPALFFEPAFGSSVRATLAQQVLAGQASRLVLYSFDFDVGTKADQLSVRGRQQLNRFALEVATGAVLVIASSQEGADRDRARRANVIKELQSLNVTRFEDRIIVGVPRTPGLAGEEAVLFDSTLLQQSRNRGGLLQPSSSNRRYGTGMGNAIRGQ